MNDNNIPQLTLSPDTAAAESVPQLTLDGSIPTPAAPAPEPEKPAVEPVKVDESMLSEAEKQAVAEFAKKIDITD